MLPQQPLFLYYLATSSFFWKKSTLPHFLKNKQNSNPHPFCKAGETQLWLIKTTCFTYSLLKIDPVIIKALDLKLKSVSSTKLTKKILMIKPKNMLRETVPYRESFWAYWYMYRDQDFKKSIGEHTIRQTDQQRLWLYLGAFWCQTFFSIFCHHFFSLLYTKSIWNAEAKSSQI